MGSGSSGGSRSSTTESALSKEQARILKSREALFTQFFRPGLIQMQQEVTQRPEDSATLSRGAATVQRATEQAQQNLQKGLAQRGLADSGLAQMGEQALAAANVRGLADVRAQAEQAQFGRRLQATQLALGTAPTPTTAAPLLQSSKSKQSSFSFLG